MIKEKLNPEQGKRLIGCLNDVGMTQKELSEKCHYTPQYVSSICAGKRNMSLESATQFGKLLNVDPEYLLCETDVKTIEERLSNFAARFFEVADVRDRALFDLCATLGITVKEWLPGTPAIYGHGLSFRGIDETEKVLVQSRIDEQGRVRWAALYEEREIPADYVAQLLSDIYDYAGFKCRQFHDRYFLGCGAVKKTEAGIPANNDVPSGIDSTQVITGKGTVITPLFGKP